MNNIFKLLWYEDDIDWYKMGKRKITTSLQSNHYLSTIIDNFNSSENIDVTKLEENKYDLILMDFKLLDGYTGNEVIEKIRTNNILTDILFYSSEENKMIESLKETLPQIDGIYLTKRDNSIFFDKVDRLITKIVRRSEDIVNLRGMVLDATSNFELITKDFLSNLWKSASQEKRTYLNEIVNEKVLSHYKDFIIETFSQLTDGKKDFEDLNNQSGLFSMNDRLTIITEYSKKVSIPLKLNNTDFKEYYTKNLSSFRNKLGHVSAGDEIKVNGEIYKINEEFHQKMRKNINELEIIFKPALDSLLDN